MTPHPEELAPLSRTSNFRRAPWPAALAMVLPAACWAAPTELRVHSQEGQMRVENGLFCFEVSPVRRYAGGQTGQAVEMPTAIRVPGRKPNLFMLRYYAHRVRGEVRHAPAVTRVAPATPESGHVCVERSGWKGGKVRQECWAYRDRPWIRCRVAYELLQDQRRGFVLEGGFYGTFRIDRVLVGTEDESVEAQLVRTPRGEVDFEASRQALREVTQMMAFLKTGEPIPYYVAWWSDEDGIGVGLATTALNVDVWVRERHGNFRTGCFHHYAPHAGWPKGTTLADDYYVFPITELPPAVEARPVLKALLARTTEDREP